MLPNINQLDNKNKKDKKQEEGGVTLPPLDFLNDQTKPNVDIDDNDIENEFDGGFEIEEIEEVEDNNEDYIQNTVSDEVHYLNEDVEIEDIEIEDLPIEDEIDAFLPTEEDIIPMDEDFLPSNNDFLPSDDDLHTDDTADEYSADEKVGEFLNELKDKIFGNLGESKSKLKKLGMILGVIALLLIVFKVGSNVMSSRPTVVKSETGSLEIKEYNLSDESIEALVNNVGDESFDGELYATVSEKKLIGSKDTVICESGILAIEPDEETEIILHCNGVIENLTKVKFELEDIY